MSRTNANIGWFPFWFWNDTLTETEIRWQIAEMARQGLRGFVPSPRQGLKQPYLADSFFKMIEVAIDAAKQHGMVVHLYDDLPYPSGAAGGEVLLGNPHFYATSLVQQVIDIESTGIVRLELPRGRILNCIACPVGNGVIAPSRSLRYSEEPDLSPWDPALRSTSETGLESGKDVDWSRVIDLRSSVGVVLTENSYQEVGLTSYNRKRFFSNVGVPTLEAKLPAGRYRIFVSAQVLVDNHKYYFHFVDVLNPEAVREFLRLTHDRYFQRFGSEFGKTIRSIFADETAPVWSERLPNEFFKRMGYELPPLLAALQDAKHPQHARVKGDFHRVKYELFALAFEKPYSDWCRAHGILYWGEKPLLRLSQLKYSDVPGCDAGHVKAGAPLDMVSAELRANPRAAASAMYFYDKPAALCECYHSLGWGATLQDLKRLADGLLLAGINCFVPHAFFYTTHGLTKHDAPPSMFFQMPYWKFFGAMVRRTERVLKEFEGTHIAAKVLVVDPTFGVPTPEQNAEFVRLQNLLLEQHVDYLLADVDVLQSGRIEAGRLLVKDLEIELIIVPPMVAVEAQLSEWLSRFASAGGRVVWFDRDFDAGCLPAASLEFAAANVHLVTRKDSSRTLWFLQNAGNESVDVRLLDEAVSEIELDGVKTLDGLDLRLEANQSVLLVKSDADLRSMKHGPEARVTICLPAPVEVKPLNANLLPLRDWELTLVSECNQIARVQPAPIIHQLEKSGLRFAPRVERAFGSVANLQLPMLQLRYVAEFANDYDGPVEVVMESGSIGGEWTIRINDSQPLEFAGTTAHVRSSLGADVSGLIRPGTNKVVVDVRTNRVDGGLLNCLYLAGDFGVKLSPLRLVPRESMGEFGNWEQNGLPFFAGVVEYRGKVEIDVIRAIVELPNEDACEVSFNGGPWHQMLWTPRQIRPSPGELRMGENDIRIRVYTTLLRAFEGQWFDSVNHRSVDVK
jgi:hypothetical protein